MPPFESVWDDTATNLLKSMHQDGASAGVISKELIAKGYNFSRNAVIGKKNRLSLPPPPAEAIHKKLKSQRQILSGKISASRPKFIFHRRPQSLGAHAIAEDLHMDASNHTGSNAILLTQSRDGQCRAIIGYEDGELAKAIICGDPTPVKLRRGRYVTSSWCVHHNELYTQEDHPRR